MGKVQGPCKVIECLSLWLALLFFFFFLLGSINITVFLFLTKVTTVTHSPQIRFCWCL